MQSDDGTKQKAAEQLLQIAGDRRAGMQDETLLRAFSDELIGEVFDLAWQHQWERDADSFRRGVRSLVTKAVERTVNDVED